MISSILLVLIGAIATGAFQLGFSVRERSREAETILTAIASEVDAVCRLVRHQQYFEFASQIAGAIRDDTWDGTTLIVDIRENYFSVYEGLASKLGMLQPIQAVKIVNFYAYCKSLIDSTRPDGPNAVSDGNIYASGNMLSVEALLISILHLGDEIIALPSTSLHLAAAQAELPAIKIVPGEVPYPPQASR